jgi:phage terminase small subunit
MRHFVHEYLKDFDQFKAALRMGYDSGTAKSAGKMLFYHSFTQLRLAEVMADLEERSVVSGGQIMAKLWQEANLGQCSNNSSVRVGALKELARIKQLGVAATNAPVSISGVMLVPVVAESEDGLTSWEDKAKASQAALKAGAIDV